MSTQPVVAYLVVKNSHVSVFLTPRTREWSENLIDQIKNYTNYIFTLKKP